MAGLLRHRQTKGAATDRLGLRDAESCSLLYPPGTFVAAVIGKGGGLILGVFDGQQIAGGVVGVLGHAGGGVGHLCQPILLVVCGSPGWATAWGHLAL